MAFGYLVEHAKFRSTYALLERPSVQKGQRSRFNLSPAGFQIPGFCSQRVGGEARSTISTERRTRWGREQGGFMEERPIHSQLRRVGTLP